MNDQKDSISALRRQSRSPKLRELLKWVAHKGEDCLVLPLTQGSDGYVAIYYEGHHTNAHRVMCRLAHGEPPTPDMHAAHSCGRGKKGCLNPEHLYWATRLQNAADSVAHGAQLRGEDTSCAVLTEDIVRAIRSTPRRRGYQNRLAKQYGVARPTITAVIAKRIWKHVA